MRPIPVTIPQISVSVPGGKNESGEPMKEKFKLIKDQETSQ